MANVIARGKCKADTEAVSERDAETAPARSWGSFHLRSVLGGRKGQNSNQDGRDRITGSGRLAEMTTLERVNALVRGAGFIDVAMPSGENPDSESDFEDIIRVPLLSVQEGNRKRKVKDLERVREWEHASRSLGFKEAHSCNSLHSMRDDNSTRPAVPRSAPTVSYQRIHTCQVSSSRTKKLRRNRRESQERMTSAGLLEHHQSLNYQSMIKTGTQEVEEKATNSGCDGEHKPEEKLLQFGLGENQSQELPVNVDSNQPSLVRRIDRVEKILSVKNRDAGSDAVFRVKESLRSCRQVVLVQGSVLQRHCPQLLRSFLKRMDQLGRRDGHTLEDTETPDFALYTQE